MKKCAFNDTVLSVILPLHLISEKYFMVNGASVIWKI